MTTLRDSEKHRLSGVRISLVAISCRSLTVIGPKKAGVLSRSWYIGEYGQLRQDSIGLSEYAEARHTFSPTRYDISTVDSYETLDLHQSQSSSTYSVLGVRFENGSWDTRLEWIYYGLGYDQTQWDLIKQGVTTPSPALQSNIAHFQRLGLELPTHNWWSLSSRISNIGPPSGWQSTNRLLVAVGDSAFGALRCGLFQSDLEAPFLASWTFFFSGQVRFGQKDSELLVRETNTVYLGVRKVW